jgi:hypothetical protein
MSSGPWNSAVGTVLALAAVLLAVASVQNGFDALGEGAAVTWRWPLAPVALAAAIATVFPVARRVGAAVLLLDAAVLVGTELPRVAAASAAARTTAEGPIPATAAADLVHGPQDLLVGMSLVLCSALLLVVGGGDRPARAGAEVATSPGAPPALLGAGSAVALALLLVLCAPAELLLTLRGTEVSAVPSGPPDAEAARASVLGGRSTALMMAFGAVPMAVSAGLWLLSGRERRRGARTLLAVGGTLTAWSFLVGSWLLLNVAWLVPALPTVLTELWPGPFAEATRSPALWTGLLMLLLLPVVAAWPAARDTAA